MGSWGRWGLAVVGLGLAGCTLVFPERELPLRPVPPLKRLAFEIVAEDGRCEPPVVAVDREGRAAVVALTFISRGSRHVIKIPDLNVRKTLEAGEQTTVEFVADKSAVMTVGCSGSRFILPLSQTGKIAVR